MQGWERLIWVAWGLFIPAVAWLVSLLLPS